MLTAIDPESGAEPANSVPNAPGPNFPSLRSTSVWLRAWLVLALVCALFSLHPAFRSRFWTGSYLPNVLQQSARNIVLAVGMTFVVVSGGIDLSVGSVLALCSVGLAMSLAGTVPLWLTCVAMAGPAALAAGLVAGRLRSASPATRTAALLLVFLVGDAAGALLLAHGMAGGVRVEGAIAVALLIGVACGMTNGLIVARGRVPAFVMTLGMLSAARGLTLYATGGASVTAAVPRLMALGQGLPLVGITLAVVVVGSILLGRTRAGRYVLAIGGNEQAAHLTGVPVARNKTLAYLLSGLTAAIGGVLVTAKFGLADTGAGTGAELDAIAAVVIGGASLSGGQGTIVGALVGALTITVIQNGLVLVQVPDTLQPVILGGVIVATVFVDQWRRKG